MKKIALIFTLLIFVFSNAFSQEKEPEIFRIVEVMPEYPGGQDEMMKYLSENIVYPPLAIENDIQGTVYVQFVVNADGEVQNVEVMRSVHEDLDAEAVRVVQSMPAWKPGQQRGKEVSVYYTMPIQYKLSGPVKKSPDAPKKSRDRK